MGLIISRAVWVAPAARRWLENTWQARVLHVFRKACNLVNSENEVLSLVAAELGPGPFSIGLEWGENWDFQEWTRPGEVLRPQKSALALGPLTLEVGRAPEWDSRPEWGSVAGRVVVDQLASLRKFISAQAPPGSLLAVLGGLFPAGGFPAPAPAGDLPERILGRGAEAARGIVAGLRAGEAGQVGAGVRLLAGLGSGLTPAGDDFLVGVLLALRIANFRREAEIAAEILDQALPRTGALSGAWLRAAARGEASWPWHELVLALAGGDRHRISAAILSILQTGHTSGADALAGFWAALSSE